MAKTKISEFSATAANNTDIDSINIAEGCAPSGINDAIRELMSQLKDFQAGTAGDSFNGPVGTTTAAAGAFTTLSASSTTTLSGLTASTALALDASKNVVSVTNTGSGNNVLATSPTLVTPALGTPSSATLTNATGLPISTGVSGLGTGVATALAVNVGSAGAPVVNGGALGTPSSGTVTNLTGTASININGTVGATTPTTGAFTTLTTSSTVTLNGGTANGVTYLNGSKVLTSGSALTFDGTSLGVGTTSPSSKLTVSGSGATLGQFISSGSSTYIEMDNSGGGGYIGTSGNSLLFLTSIAGSEQMRLTSTGLGIGTSSPAAKLDVTTSGLVSSFGSTSTAETYIQVKNGTSTLYLGGKSDQNYVYGTAAIPLVFYTNSTARATLDSSGNLGLGVTPSAWNTSIFRTVQVGTGAGSASLSGRSDGGKDMVLGSNVYYGTGSFRYVGTGVATMYRMDGAAHAWSYAGSGNAGDAITFTQAMSLLSGGSLVIGATSQLGAEKLGLARSSYGEMLRWTDFTVGGYIGTTSSGLTEIVSGNGLIFKIDNTERARIDSSGNLLVGTTSAGSGATTGRMRLVGNSGGINNFYSEQSVSGGYCFSGNAVSNGGTYYFMDLRAAGTQTGSITSNGTTTSYNITSDQRLKENIQDAESASSLIDSLQVRKFDWKSNSFHQRYGFVAQELVQVAPEAVHQPAAPEEMMSVDYSKLVPMLVKEIQSLRKRLADAGIA